MAADRLREEPRDGDDDINDSEHGDSAVGAPADSGHSDADTQTQRNIEDEPAG